MVFIQGGMFLRGSDKGAPDEQPVREIRVNSFWMDATEVTNDQFTEFVKATGYITVAERKPDAAQFPGVPPEKLVPGSAVFRSPEGDPDLSEFLTWWEYRPGANWRHPEGPSSNLSGRGNHPVVHVCWLDAIRYAEWAGKSLPTEAEWEYAARGGLKSSDYCWEGNLTPGGRWMANIWQGSFPKVNDIQDGFQTSAPVKSFPPNGYGLYDMAGNVWEWCADLYLPTYYASCPSDNPPGPDTSFDPNEPGVAKRVQRGGSYLCSDVYCTGYRPSARMKSTPDTGLSHSGFRCVKR
ncbi:MAG: formylglycine-generating enzyme family protein [Verrucomicrobia bacterium]|nr:formylglycine-generating enzyme family protein [Verrucomicrobiota bacterium]